MLSYAQALQCLLDAGQAVRLPVERLALDRALGRVLDQAVVAPSAVPGFDNSAMDGFAIHAADAEIGAQPREIGVQWAGLDAGLALRPGECVRITTGAPLPANTDRVIQKENVEIGTAGVRLLDSGQPGGNLRRAGEDIARGTEVLKGGALLDAAKLGALASCGVDAVNVIAVPRVAVLTTGDELRSPGESLAPGQIYDSNRCYLLAALREQGLEPTAWPAVRDDRATLSAALQQLTEVFDVVLCCGGVSAGERDLLPSLLAELGEVVFHKLRIKPGMPFLFARVGAALVCALPGNPVSVLATFQQLVLPLLNALRGRAAAPPRQAARLSAAISKRHARAEFMRGRGWIDEDGQLQVEPEAATGSHRLLAAAQCNGLIVLPEGAGEWLSGSRVEFSPWASLP